MVQKKNSEYFKACLIRLELFREKNKKKPSRNIGDKFIFLGGPKFFDSSMIRFISNS